jgi:hypothetical protein
MTGSESNVWFSGIIKNALRNEINVTTARLYIMLVSPTSAWRYYSDRAYFILASQLNLPNGSQVFSNFLWSLDFFCLGLGEMVLLG